MPAFLALVLFEKWWGWYRGRDTVRQLDMISSLSSGITNATKDVLGLSITIISYEWMVNHLALTRLAAGWPVYLVSFFALDFAGYWTHRLDHENNFLWNSHIIHHSSEDFNLACALRQNVSIIVRLFTFFLLPAALLGVPANVIAIVAPLHLFAQFWYHTQHIGKMGWLEYAIVTPSHHRVHHAFNPEYIDKNYGQILIIWDKLFGTFQEEMPDVPPVYGITRPVQTWNPIRINFQHLSLLINDAWRTRKWSDKCRIWFKPTGWRPADVQERYPVHKIHDVYDFEKYERPTGSWQLCWIWVQVILLLLFISYLFGNIASIGSPGIFVYGLFIFLFVYALTEMMDQHPQAWLWELAKCATGIGILVYYRDWFGAGSYAGWIIDACLVYFFISLLLSWFFSLRHHPALKKAF